MGPEGSHFGLPKASKIVEVGVPNVEDEKLQADIERVAKKLQRTGRAIENISQSTSPEKQKRIGEKLADIGRLLYPYALRLSGIFVAYQGWGWAAATGTALSVSAPAIAVMVFALGTALMTYGMVMYKAGDDKAEEYRKRGIKS